MVFCERVSVLAVEAFLLCLLGWVGPDAWQVKGSKALNKMLKMMLAVGEMLSVLRCNSCIIKGLQGAQDDACCGRNASISST